MLPILTRGWREHFFLWMCFFFFFLEEPTYNSQSIYRTLSTKRWKFLLLLYFHQYGELKDHKDSSTAWPTCFQHWNIFSQILYFTLFINHCPHHTPQAAKIYNTPHLSVEIAKSGNCSVVKGSTVTSCFLQWDKLEFMSEECYYLCFKKNKTNQKTNQPPKTPNLTHTKV